MAPFFHLAASTVTFRKAQRGTSSPKKRPKQTPAHSLLRRRAVGSERQGEDRYVEKGEGRLPFKKKKKQSLFLRKNLVLQSIIVFAVC